MSILKYATLAVLEAEIANGEQRLMKDAHRAQFAYVARPGFLYVRSRAISSRTNDNYDTFPGTEIKAAWSTFIGKPVFVNHENSDPEKARGVIIDAALHEDTAPDGTEDTWVEVLMEIDAVRYPKLAARILDGSIERTSMGVDCGWSECSFCGNVARTQYDYCAHVRKMKGQRIERRATDGSSERVLVHEICGDLHFFENSVLVEPPADPTAHFLGVDDSGLEEIEREAILATASKTASEVVSGLEHAMNVWRRSFGNSHMIAQAAEGLTTEEPYLSAAQTILEGIANGPVPRYSYRVDHRLPNEGDVLDFPLISTAANSEEARGFETLSNSFGLGEARGIWYEMLGGPAAAFPDGREYILSGRYRVKSVRDYTPKWETGVGSYVPLRGKRKMVSMEYVGPSQKVKVAKTAVGGKGASLKTASWRDQTIEVRGEMKPLSLISGGKWYHGTGAKLSPGDTLTPGHGTNFSQSARDSVSITSDYPTAVHWAKQVSPSDPIVYEIEPIGAVEGWKAGLAEYGKAIVVFEARVSSARVLGQARMASLKTAKPWGDTSPYDEDEESPESYAFRTSKGTPILGGKYQVVYRQADNGEHAFVVMEGSPGDYYRCGFLTVVPKGGKLVADEIQVNYKREGIATALFHVAEQKLGPIAFPTDLGELTPDGLAWSRKMQGLPVGNDVGQAMWNPLTASVEKRGGRVSRGFPADIGLAGLGRDAVGIWQRMKRKAATADDLLSIILDRRGSAGSQWALEDDYPSEFEGWSDRNVSGDAYTYAEGSGPSGLAKNWVEESCGLDPTDEEIWEELEDNLGEIEVVLIGDSDDAEYINPSWDAAIKSGSHINLTEIQYDAGWGWVTVPARGKQIVAKTAAARTYTVVSAPSGGGWEMHIAGCTDLAMPKYARSTKDDVTAGSWQEAVSAYIDGDLGAQGYSPSDIRVITCAKTGVAPDAPAVDLTACPASGTRVTNVRGLKGNCPACGKFLSVGRGVWPKHAPYVRKGASMKKSATGLSEGKDYSTGYRFVYFDIDLPGDPVGLRAKAQETSINEWVITTFYGPYKERDSSGSYYESGPSESFSGPIAGARALVKRKAKEMAQNIPPRTAKVAFGETRAPTQVNTLSLQECPVCGEEGSFDASGRCRVCAFVPPPEPFRAPDLDLAQKVDIGDGWVNTDLYRAQPFQPEPEEDPTDDGPAAHVGGRALSTQAQGRGNGQRIAPEEINDMANAATLVRQAAERQLQRKADLDNPAQPVSEPAPQAATQTDEEAVKPDAKEEVTSPGGELPNAEPEATVDVTQPGQVTPEPTPDDVTDPTVPVAGAGEVNAEQNKVTPDVDGSGGDMTNAFQEGWTARQRQAMQRREARLKARIFASLRLASMRIENGLTQGDLITEAQRIEESGESDEAIRTQMTTIAAMAKARPVVASRPAAQRAIPSLASGRAPQVAVPPNVGLSVDQDEINW